MMIQIQAWLTSARYALIEQGRNRFALGLLIIFVPIWDWLFGALITDAPWRSSCRARAPSSRSMATT